MSLRKELRMVGLVLAGVLVLAAPAWGAPPPPGTNGFDTNGDGKDDLNLECDDTDGDGKTDKIHFDKNMNGDVDRGEPVIENIKRYSHAKQPRSGYQWDIDYWIDKEHVGSYEVTGDDRNGDGDTADTGELEW